jgi:3-deoxy-D-manno-octulosonate 8-phosphate phosphatase KdsC-like HAD superfamily phosphatase
MKAKTIYIDCDGVLTDGKLTIDHRGEKMFKSFHTRDVRAIRELISVHGFEVILVSADDWDGLHRFADKVGAVVHLSREKSAASPVYIAVGDDAWDMPLLKDAQRAFCPRDADWSVKKLPHIEILDCNGGQGVIAELLTKLCQS